MSRPPQTVFGLQTATLRLLSLLGVLALLASMAFNLLGVVSLPGLSGASHSDFDMFHTVAKLALAGRLDEAYDLQTMYAAQLELGGVPSAMTWTYPPPFDLLLAPLGALGRDPAYLLFTGLGLALYVAVLARLAGPYFALALIGALPAVMMSVRTGQNGCLIAALAAMACVSLARGRDARAGVPLGLLVIKPHLGVGLGLYCLAAARWQALAVAFGVAVGACALSTLAFGTEIWGHFLGAVGEAGAQLEAGGYRSYRMGSLHATLTGFGAAHGLAMAAQACVALFAVVTIGIAARRLAPRPALAVTLMASPLFSPYLYDYDLALYGPALALLLPELDRAGRRVFALPLIALAWVAGGTGMVQNTRGAESGDVAGVTLAGAATLLLALATLLILLRQPGRAPAAPPEDPPAAVRTA